LAAKAEFLVYKHLSYAEPKGKTMLRLTHRINQL